MTAGIADMELLRANALARFAAAGLCGTPANAPKEGPPSDPLSVLLYDGGFDRRNREAQDGGQAMYDGTMSTTLLPRELVSAILPPLTELATPKDASQTVHPVIYLLGTQNDPRGLAGGQVEPIPGAVPYNELTLLIPFVVHVGRDRWHSFAARMYLDDGIAIVIGDIAYAYSKEVGAFASFGSLTEVSASGNTMFESELVGDTVWMNEAQAKLLPGFTDACRILEMPIVGYSSLYGHVRSYFEWDYSSAQIAATDTVHRFLQEFRPGMQPWVLLNYLTNAPHCAFRLRNVRWRLSTKFPKLEF